MNIEQRVIFKLDLPNRKVISVKSKSCKALGEVLRPILHKYNYRLDLVQVISIKSNSIFLTLMIRYYYNAGIIKGKFRTIRHDCISYIS